MTDDALEARTHSGLGDRNRRTVLRELVLRGPSSRVEIAAEVGLTGATLSRIARELLDAGLVRELPEGPDAAPRGRGRIPVLLDVAPQGGRVLGIGIAAALQTVTLSSLKNEVVAGVELNLDTLDDPGAVIETVAAESRRLIDTHVPDRDRLFGGVALIAGTVDPASGSVLQAPDLGWTREVPFRDRLAALLGLPMQVESLAGGIALAEARFGAARGRADALVFTCGLGIAAGLVLDGRLVGRRPTLPPGQIGRMAVAGNGPGAMTLDEAAGGFGVLRRLHGGAVEPARAATTGPARALLDAVRRDGDPVLAASMTAAGFELGRAAAGFVRLVAPEVVVIAGILSMSPHYVSAAREAIVETLDAVPVEVAAGIVTGPLSGHSASCGLAVCEYLFERTPDLAGLSAR